LDGVVAKRLVSTYQPVDAFCDGLLVTDEGGVLRPEVDLAVERGPVRGQPAIHGELFLGVGAGAVHLVGDAHRQVSDDADQVARASGLLGRSAQCRADVLGKCARPGHPRDGAAGAPSGEPEHLEPRAAT
jgi:hypothetical protein